MLSYATLPISIDFHKRPIAIFSEELNKTIYTVILNG